MFGDICLYAHMLICPYAHTLNITYWRKKKTKFINILLWTKKLEKNKLA